MEQIETATADSRIAIADPEPGHLHFDRASRRWLSHEVDGSLRPFAGSQAIDTPTGDDHHAAAA